MNYTLKQVDNCIDKIARVLGAAHVRSDVTISLQVVFGERIEPSAYNVSTVTTEWYVLHI